MIATLVFPSVCRYLAAGSPCPGQIYSHVPRLGFGAPNIEGGKGRSYAARDEKSFPLPRKHDVRCGLRCKPLEMMAAVNTRY